MSRDVYVGLVVLALAGLYWLGADAIRESPLAGGVGADGLPKALAATLAFLSLLLIGRSFVFRRALVGPKISTEERAKRRQRHLRALGMLAIGIGYLLIVPYLGYILSVFLLMAATAIYNGRQASPSFWVTVAAGALFFYFLFVRFLDIPLPPGIWPDLIGAF